MNTLIYDPNDKTVTENDYESSSEYINENEDNMFHIGQGYEEKVCKTVYCKKCGGNKFNVGTGNYYTAIKCVTCEWELCIHEG